MGPHGAGLSNMVMCQQGTLVLEFLTRDIVNVVFFTTAVKLKLRYMALSFPDSTQNRQMTANITEVLHWLRYGITGQANSV